MENQISPLSSFKQNSDIIIYHNRSKSTLTGSQSSRVKGRIITTDLSRDSQHSTLRSERSFLTVSPFSREMSPYQLQNRTNVLKDFVENGPSRAQTPQTVLFSTTENEKSMVKLEEENKELKRQLKVCEERIQCLLKENQDIKHKSEELRQLTANRDSQLKSENECLKTELEALAKRVNELEEEKAKLLAGKNHTVNEITHSLVKYTKYIVSCVAGADKNSFTHFCFEERFTSEKNLLVLINAEEFGTIALQAFRYISDLLAHVNLPAVQTIVQKYHGTQLKKKDHRMSPNEISSGRASPLRVEAKKVTPKNMAKDLENRGLLLRDIDKGQESRSGSPFQVSQQSLEDAKRSKDLTKKATTENKSRAGSQKIGKSESSGSLAQGIKARNPGHITNLNGQKLVSPCYGSIVGNGTERNIRHKLEKEGGQVHATAKKRESEGRETGSGEKSGNKKGESRYLEAENSLNESKGGIRRESSTGYERRIESVGARLIDESLCGRDLLEDDRVNESHCKDIHDKHKDLRSTISIKSILEQGLGKEQRINIDIDIKDENTKPDALVNKNKPLYEGKHKSNESIESLLENLKERSQSRSGVSKGLEDEMSKNGRRFKHVEVTLEIDNQKDKPLQDAQTSYHRKVSGNPSKGLNLSHGKIEEAAIPFSMKENLNVSKDILLAQPVDFNSGGLRLYKEKVRLCSVQNPERPCSVQANVANVEKMGERFVTFDGTDNQNLFTCSDRESKASASKKGDPKDSLPLQEAEDINIKPLAERNENSQQRGRRSPDENFGGIINILNRRKTNSSPHPQDLLSGNSIESNRVRLSRGDFNL